MIEPAFRDWLAKTDTEILLCWDLGHIWTGDLYDRIEKGPHGAHLLTASCDRGCRVERTRYLTSTWDVDSGRNTYRYPPGYSPKETLDGRYMDSAHRSAIRKELARRAKEDQQTSPAPVIPFRGAS